MKELFLDGLVMAYMGAGVICCIAYFPTIRDLYCYKKRSANKTTYLLWTITASITLLYSCFILTDRLFKLISVANFICCLLILLLSTRLPHAAMDKDKDIH